MTLTSLSMKYILLFCTIIFIQQLTFSQQNILWYTKPATKWVEALPVGNGRMGAMVFGDPNHERIQLNEETIWAGTRVNDINPAAKGSLKEVQQLLLEEKNTTAYELTKKNLLGTPPQIRSYQTLGDLFFDWDSSSFTVYKRELDIETGIHRTVFTKKNAKIREDVFLSAADNILVVKISSSVKGGLTGTIRLSRSQDAVVTASGKQLVMMGQIIDVESPEIKGPAGAHLRFSGVAKVENIGGSCQPKGNALEIKGATEIVLRFTAFSNYNPALLNQDSLIQPLDSCLKILAKSALKYHQLETRHLAEAKPSFNACSLYLESTVPDFGDPTDVRLEKFRNGAIDPGLAGLYFNYGRYLLISSSRKPARLPANLQGKWNEHIDAPWQSDYHTNINLQMNYWPADLTNTNTYEPLAAFMKSMIGPGMLCAKNMYGAKGWAMHHVTDIYGRTSLNADPQWGTSPLAGAWMALTMYDHYDYTRDEKYLRDYAWPLMKGSADFILDFLVPDSNGLLVTAPSMSPENGFYLAGDSATRHVITYAPAIDMQIIRELFSAIRKVSATMNISTEFRQKMAAVEQRLPPISINRYGGIQEWIKDYAEEEPGHRHSNRPGLPSLASVICAFCAASMSLLYTTRNRRSVLRLFSTPTEMAGIFSSHSILISSACTLTG